MHQRDTSMDERVQEALGMVIPLIAEKGYALTLHQDSAKNGRDYVAYADRLEELWTDHYENGTAFTNCRDVSNEQFGKWLAKQPADVKRQVLENIETYRTSEPVVKQASRYFGFEDMV